jgi:hypothetical protein
MAQYAQARQDRLGAFIPIRQFEAFQRVGGERG